MKKWLKNVGRDITRGAVNVCVRTMLSWGYADKVYRFVCAYGSNAGSGSFALGRYDAANDASELLIKHHGYHRCPSCTWATKHADEHLTPGSWCHDDLFFQREREIEVYGYDHTTPWNQQSDGASAFLALPDREQHRQGLV